MQPVPGTPLENTADSAKPGQLRRIGFRLAAILLPLAIVFALEWGLRLSGRYQSTSFWIPHGDSGTWMPNPAFAARFVGPSMARMPRSGLVQPANSTGPDSPLRILVFGESAALGDPEPAFGMPRFLQALLEARLPGRRVEVLNTAVTALNSHAIREAARDSRDLKADFWVLYPGNNEVIGPFGPASMPSGAPPSLAAIRFGLAARQSALGQWIANRQAASASGLSLTQRWTGLDQFLERPIPATHPALPAVRDTFATNLRDIIQYGLASGAQVLVGTMAVNLADFPPLGSDSPRDTNSPATRSWMAAVEAGRSADARGDFAAAVSAWTNAVAQAPADAETRYRLGLARLNAGEFKEARRDLELARDLDTLRFRADSGINQATRDVVAALGSPRVALVDADRSLKGTDPDRPPGADLFFEHVHLRPEGNYELARLFAESIVNSLGSPAGPNAWLSYEDCLDRLGWTPFAAARVWGQIRTLAQRPPFSRQSHAALRDQYVEDRVADATRDARTLGLTAAVTRLKSAVGEHPEDWELREQLVRLLQLGRQWTNAVAEEREVLRRAPGHVVGWFELGESLAQAGQRDAAVEAYQRALAIRPDFIEARLGLAQVYSDSGRPTEALATLDGILNDAPQDLYARVNRGMILIGMKRSDAGIEELQRAARDNPASTLPLVRLAEVYSAQNSHAAAASVYAEAVAREPANPSLRHRMGIERSKAGQPAAAEAALREALQLAPDFYLGHLDLGVALAQQSRFSEAVPEFEAAQRLQPTNSLPRQYLDLARKKLQEGGGN
ncbi:MAG: tetratricopeptide repeat protein [Verrucomicrobiales bacterium]|nr:tetratricopeptide repeat protein [Verrucomicrobiales bacterium]